MIRCSICVMPNTRPDTPFQNGICQACINYARRPKVDWEAREKELLQLLDRFNGECIVPSSGGKDSTYQAITLKNMGADVTAVTARTCHLTPIGRANIDNLARHVKTIEIVPNMTDRAKLNRIGLEMVGDISWPEHVAIFTTPFRAAMDLRIPLMFYGENPQDQYGGPQGSEGAKQMTRRWRSEFGGFLGLRPQDLEGMLSKRAMEPYTLPATAPGDIEPEAHFLGAYLPWDSHKNSEVARAAGMRGLNGPPALANWWEWENLDNTQTGIHDHLMYRKYGYGRGCAQISVDVRTGRVPRDMALARVDAYDGRYPYVYAGIPIEEMLDRLDMTKEQLWEKLEYFTNPEYFDMTDRNYDGVPKLK